MMTFGLAVLCLGILVTGFALGSRGCIPDIEEHHIQGGRFKQVLSWPNGIDNPPVSFIEGWTPPVLITRVRTEAEWRSYHRLGKIAAAGAFILALGIFLTALGV